MNSLTVIPKSTPATPPSSFSDFFFNYLFVRTYWEDAIVDEIAPRVAPIVMYKLGRRQVKSFFNPIVIGVALLSYPLIFEHVVEFIRDMIEWLVTFVTSI